MLEAKDRCCSRRKNGSVGICSTSSYSGNSIIVVVVEVVVW